MEKGIARVGRKLLKSMKGPALPCRMIRCQGPGVCKVILTLAVFSRPPIDFEQWFGVLKDYVLLRE